jgi:hypothetical protein
LLSSRGIQSARTGARRNCPSAVSGGLNREGVKVLTLRLGDVTMPASLSDVFYLRIDPSDPGAIAARILRDVRSHLDERPARDATPQPTSVSGSSRPRLARNRRQPPDDWANVRPRNTARTWSGGHGQKAFPKRIRQDGVAEQTSGRLGPDVRGGRSNFTHRDRPRRNWTNKRRWHEGKRTVCRPISPLPHSDLGMGWRSWNKYGIIRLGLRLCIDRRA